MDYTSIKVTCNHELSEVLIALLFELGFDSFQENEDGGFIASIPQKDFNELILKNTLEAFPGIKYSLQDESRINWNEEWEKNYDPIIVDNKCLVRATFHEPLPYMDYELLITPKMSFGTGHHDTTYQVLSYEMKVDFKDKNVLDVGCGTAILSVMAYKRGAKCVVATDIDDWCIANSKENFELNKVPEDFYELIQGQIEKVTYQNFDIIIANINKNVLLDQISDYSIRLKAGGQLIISGFYQEDIDDLLVEAEKHELLKIESTQRNRWAMVALKKLTT